MPRMTVTCVRALAAALLAAAATTAAAHHTDDPVRELSLAMGAAPAQPGAALVGAHPSGRFAHAHAVREPNVAWNPSGWRSPSPSAVARPDPGIRTGIGAGALLAQADVAALPSGLTVGTEEGLRERGAFPAPEEYLEELRALSAEAIPLLSVYGAPKPLPDGLVLIHPTLGETGFDAFADRLRLVNFWATWCPPCRHEMPDLDALNETLGGDDFAVLAVNLDRNGLERAREFYEEESIETLEILVDPRSRASGELGVVSLPTSIVITPTGHEVARIAGVADWDSEETVEYFRQAIKLTGPVSGPPAGVTSTLQPM